jgi:hypothetical protein
MMAIPTKKSDLYFRAAMGLSALGFVAFAGSVYFYWSHLHQGGISGRSDDWGSFGAYVSGIAGTVIALTTLVALAITLALQARELERARHAAARQIFDSTFFHLMERFNEVLISVSAQRLNEETGEHEPLQGRVAIGAIYSSMIKTYPVDAGPDVRASIVQMFTPYYGVHESVLGPYFRTLYHVFKFIDGQQELDDQEKIDYANIARAQLSRYELGLMFYDCVTDYGAKFKPLIEKYGILKHLNTFDLADVRHKTLYSPTAFESQEQREARAARHRSQPHSVS